MTNEQESRFSMYLATTGFCDANATITANLPNFAANLTSVKTTCIQIQAISEQQRFDKTGITENKNQLKTNLITMASDNARKLMAYAKFTNNQTLLAEINITESDFKRAADTAVKDYAQIIYDRAQPIVATLSIYGITTASQTALLNAITNYNAILGAPRIGITVKSQATKQLVALLKLVDTALLNMDAAVEIIRLSQVNYYNGYKTARKIVSTGIGTLAVKGLVTDAESGEPVKGVTVSFVQENEMMLSKSATMGKIKPVVTKKTADKGGFNVKSMPAGTYQVKIKKEGYQEQLATVYVNDGELSELKLEISKN